ncbi:MAG: 2Fe-2S iron-sulfur cluster binding domain-containing protein [Blastocatellia bacterium]|jgi:ferredoxin|nr:2Fe-2S iron-sulfur cluster binding domain-containing protein [Blastocatellia bacterium]
MKVVVLRPLNDKVVVKTETNILDTLLARNCEVAMACGGQGICATCHVYVKEGQESLSPMTSREKRTLSLITGSNSYSRLACQAKVIGEGVVVELPEGMYLETASDLTTLIGRRAEVPILHPRDGRVLIPKGKIITKSRIMELQNENLDVMELRGSTGDL